MNDKTQKIVMVAAAIGLMALIYFYFRKETEEVIANDVNGDSFNVKSEKEAIDADTSMTATEKALAKEELNQISQLRIKYKQEFGAEAPITYTLIQLQAALETKEEADYYAACSEYKKNIGESVPKSCTTAAQVNQEMSKRVAEMRTKYAQYFKNTAPESMTYIAMQAAIEKDKIYQAQEKERKANEAKAKQDKRRKMWSERCALMERRAKDWADDVFYVSVKDDRSSWGPLWWVNNEWLGDVQNENTLLNNVERLYMFEKAYEIMRKERDYDIGYRLYKLGQSSHNSDIKNSSGRIEYVKNSIVESLGFDGWEDYYFNKTKTYWNEYGECPELGVTNPYNI